MATRAAIAPEAGEENIKTLDLIFFESNGNGTGTFKGWKELTSASGSPLEMNTDIVFDFSDIGLKTTDAYDILAVANMGSNYLPTDGSQSMDDWKNAIKNSNFKTARAEVQAFMAGTSADIPEYITKPIVSEALLMKRPSLRKESEDTKISIVLQRSVARFDVLTRRQDIRLNPFPYGTDTLPSLCGTESLLLSTKRRNELQDSTEWRAKPVPTL